MTTCEIPTTSSRCRAAPKKGFGSRLRWIPGLMAAWHERNRQRREYRELMAMPDYLLKDVGVTREELYREVRKPFWRP